MAPKSENHCSCGSLLVEPDRVGPGPMTPKGFNVFYKPRVAPKPNLEYGPYRERFPKSCRVRIADEPALRSFKASWKYHNPLTDDQILYAGTTTTVAGVGYYHGGDVLYHLHGVPGNWHEACIYPDEEPDHKEN
jgi:hypothetical protein